MDPIATQLSRLQEQVQALSLLPSIIARQADSISLLQSKNAVQEASISYLYAENESLRSLVGFQDGYVRSHELDMYPDGRFVRNEFEGVWEWWKVRRPFPSVSFFR